VSTLSFSERIFRHLGNRQSIHGRIADGFLWVSFFALIGKLAGAAKEMAVAARYGVSETVDAYVFVFNLITWPIAVWFSVLTVVLVPLMARVRNDSPGAIPQFRSELLGLSLLVASVLGIATVVALPVAFHTGWTGLSKGALERAYTFSAPMAFLVPLGVLISFFLGLDTRLWKASQHLARGCPLLGALSRSHNAARASPRAATLGYACRVQSSFGHAGSAFPLARNCEARA
jgi:putative peptidoglycan lipid II flippase